MVTCLCEHKNHSSRIEDKDPTHCGHDYGAKFPAEEVVSVSTIYGSFDMCRTCANELPAGFILTGQ